jgi:hypothetical protein
MPSITPLAVSAHSLVAVLSFTLILTGGTTKEIPLAGNESQPLQFAHDRTHSGLGCSLKNFVALHRGRSGAPSCPDETGTEENEPNPIVPTNGPTDGPTWLLRRPCPRDERGNSIATSFSPPTQPGGEWQTKAGPRQSLRGPIVSSNHCVTPGVLRNESSTRWVTPLHQASCKSRPYYLQHHQSCIPRNRAGKENRDERVTPFVCSPNIYHFGGIKRPDIKIDVHDIGIPTRRGHRCTVLF